jgi:hypothetical protein
MGFALVGCQVDKVEVVVYSLLCVLLLLLLLFLAMEGFLLVWFFPE